MEKLLNAALNDITEALKICGSVNRQNTDVDMCEIKVKVIKLRLDELATKLKQI